MKTHTRVYTLIGLMISSIALIPAMVSAGPIVRSGEAVSISADQVLKGDFYGLGSSVSISGVAEHDAYIGGGTVTVNAPVQGDLTVVGGVVQVHAAVNDDVRVVGGEVLLAEPITGDVVVAGGVLKILSTATVGGDVLFLGGEATIEGDVAGSIIGTTERVRIDATVGGDVSVRATNSFTLGDNAQILGNISYKSQFDVIRAQDAEVTGTISKEAVVVESGNAWMQLLIMQILVLLFASLTLFLIAREPLAHLVERTVHSYGMQGLVGICVFLFGAPLGILLVTSVLGSIVGIALLFAYVLLLIISLIASGIVLGAVLERLILKKSTISFLTVIFGTIAIGILILVPVLGPLALFLLYIIILGGLSTGLYRLFR